MRLATLLLVAVACSKPAPAPAPTAPRSREELAKQIRGFAALVKTTLPSIGDPAFVRPPTDEELAWVNDRRLPVGDRIAWGSGLYDDEVAILQAYTDPLLAEAQAHPDTAKDTPEDLTWSEACIDSFARLTDLMLDEFLPSVSRTDGSFETRLDGAKKMAAGALTMLQGTLVTLNARRVDVAARRHLLAVWSAHVASFRKLWSADDCAKIQGWLSTVVPAEKDPALTRGLQDLGAAMQGCHGVMQ
jgi:hypothetical protein